MASKQKRSAMDVYDDIRAQFDKIAKLTTDIEEWQRLQSAALEEAERTGDPVKNVTQDHHVAAARAIPNATKAMGNAVRVLNRYCVEVTHVHEQHAYDALDKFFDPKRED